MEASSERISGILHDIGFSPSNIECTHALWSGLEQVLDLNKFDHETTHVLISGSWMEGFAPLLVKCEMLTDVDVMVIVEEWIESGKDVEYFRMISESRNPGFVKLEVVNEPKDMADIPIVKKGNKGFLASLTIQNLFALGGKYLIQNFSKAGHEASIISEFLGDRAELDLQETRHDGPAYAVAFKRPFDLFGGSLIKKVDVVVALGCPTWPKVALEWIERERKHNWPPNELIGKCVNKGCLLVPIGCKLEKCPEEDLEWRVSFNSAITQLFWSLDPIQYKCFAILKLILHNNIKPRLEGDEITSFIMKTSLLWYLEENGNIWDSTDLLSYVQDCLSKVCKWVEDDFCPDYFIPKHNLLRGRYNEEQRLNILAVLYQILDEFPRCFLQIPLFLESVDRELEIPCPDPEDLIDNEEIESNPDSVAKCSGNEEIVSVGKYTKTEEITLLKSDFIAPIGMSFIFQELISFKMVFFLNTHFTETPKRVVEKLDIFLTRDSLENAVIRYIQTKRIGLQTLISLESADVLEPERVLQDLVSRVKAIINKPGYSVEPAPLTALANIYMHFYDSVTEMFVEILDDLIGNYRTSGYVKPLGFVSDFTRTDSTFQSKVKESQGVDVGTDIVLILNHQFSIYERPILPKAMQIEITCNVLKNKDSDLVRKLQDYAKFLSILATLGSHSKPTSVDPLVFASVLQFQCYTRLGDEQGQFKALDNLQYFCHHQYTMYKCTSLHLLGHCFIQRHEKHKAFETFAASFKRKEKSNASVWHMAMFLHGLLK